MGLSPVFSQSTSERPVVVVIPFAPGGGTDVLARMTMPKIAEKLGTVAVIENRSGAAGGCPAARAVRRRPAVRARSRALRLAAHRAHR